MDITSQIFDASVFDPCQIAFAMQWPCQAFRIELERYIVPDQLLDRFGRVAFRVRKDDLDIASFAKRIQRVPNRLRPLLKRHFEEQLVRFAAA